MEPAHSLRRSLIILLLFGSIVGYVEAATVVYVRLMYEPIHQRLFPDRPPDDLFPMFSFEQWSREAPPYARSPALEVVREPATVLAVGLVAFAVAPTRRRWAAAFFLLLGVSGLSYYGCLKLLTGWPHAVSDWDMIFLLPLPWVGPVWAALAAYVVMVVAAGWFFWGEAAGRPLRAGRAGWLLLLVGALVTAMPFLWDFQHLLAGGYPRAFNSGLLAAGLLVVLAGLTYAWRQGAKRAPGQKNAAAPAQEQAGFPH